VFGRRRIQTRGELVRSEFGESMDHFRQAATHAAGGVGATVGPNYGKAKDKVSTARDWTTPKSGKVTGAASSSWDTTMAALAPLLQAAREGATKASELEAKGIKIDRNGTKKVRMEVETTSPEHHMSGTVAALIATGAAVGAAGALAARRRNRVKWSEYEPSQLHSDAKDLLDSSSTATTSLSDDARGIGEPGMIKKAAGWTKDHAQQAYGSARRKIHEATADHRDLGDDMSTAADTMKNRTGEMTEEARGSVRKANEHLNEGASHFGDKTKDKLNESASRANESMKGSGDSVDDVMRSSKNGRM
jgi:hypothetical protein